jgi:hypothetical protein
MPGASGAPAASRAKEKAHEQSHHRFAGSRRHSLRSGFNGFLRSLLGDRLLTPSPGGNHRKLGTSTGVSGRHDFAVRGQCIRLVHCRVHRIPHPTFVTTAKRPS